MRTFAVALAAALTASFISVGVTQVVATGTSSKLPFAVAADTQVIRA